MKGSTIYYLARVFSIVIVGFFALFILEGFSPQFGLVDALVHLALTLVVLAISAIAWKWPKIGGWLFIAFGFWLALFLKQGFNSLVIGGVPIITGFLFLIQGKFFDK
jgi:hypothetical protein